MNTVIVRSLRLRHGARFPNGVIYRGPGAVSPEWIEWFVREKYLVTLSRIVGKPITLNHLEQQTYDETVHVIIRFSISRTQYGSDELIVEYYVASASSPNQLFVPPN